MREEPLKRPSIERVNEHLADYFNKVVDSEKIEDCFMPYKLKQDVQVVSNYIVNTSEPELYIKHVRADESDEKFKKVLEPYKRQTKNARSRAKASMSSSEMLARRLIMIDN